MSPKGKSSSTGRAGARKRGALSGLRGGIKGLTGGGRGRSSGSSSTFWNVLTYVALAGALVLLITRYAC